MKKIKHWHMIALFLVCYDTVAVGVSYFIGLWSRFDFIYSRIPGVFLHAYIQFMPIYIMVSLVVFYALRLYNSIWRFASYHELMRLAAASVLTSVFHAIGMTVFFCRMPTSYYLFGALLQFALLAAVRFSYRFILLERNRLQTIREDLTRQRVMIIGAGAAGQMILRDIVKNNAATM